MNFTMIDVIDLNYTQMQIIANIVRNGKRIGVRDQVYREIINVTLELSPMCWLGSEIHHLDVVKEKILPQISKLVDLFKEDRCTRRAYLFFPELEEGEPPCNLIYHFMIRDYKILLNVYLRSSDVINKFCSDMFTAIYCSNYISYALNIQRGPIMVVIASAHCLEDDLVAEGYV